MAESRGEQRGWAAALHGMARVRMTEDVGHNALGDPCADTGTTRDPKHLAWVEMSALSTGKHRTIFRSTVSDEIEAAFDRRGKQDRAALGTLAVNTDLYLPAIPLHHVAPFEPADFA